MNIRTRAPRPALRLVAGFVVPCVVASFAFAAVSSSGGPVSVPGPVRVWPCRLVVKPTLFGVVEDGWKRSATLRGQCRELADARAVVVLEWGPSDSYTRASTRLGKGTAGTVIAMVHIPPVSEAIELVAHELEHVLERTRGLDLATESRRPGSGVWKAFGGLESQRAIDAGRQVAKEVADSRRTR